MTKKEQIDLKLTKNKIEIAKLTKNIIERLADQKDKKYIESCIKLLVALGESNQILEDWKNVIEFN